MGSKAVAFAAQGHYQPAMAALSAMLMQFAASTEPAIRSELFTARVHLSGSSSVRQLRAASETH